MCSACSRAIAAVQGALARAVGPAGGRIVTATKRETSLQSTPLAITALDSRMLQEQAIFSIDDFRRGPCRLQIQTPPINPATLQLAVRGISNLDVSQMTRESPVAVYVDGVYLGRTRARTGSAGSRAHRAAEGTAGKPVPAACRGWRLTS
jgi:iron complex outermembrane receptor protein